MTADLPPDQPARLPQKLWPLGLLGAALVALCWAHSNVYGDVYCAPYYMLGILAGFLLLCAALAYAAQPTTVRRERAVCGLVMIFALGARLPYLAKGPIRSSDVYRYMWDGKLQRRGINPYIYAPNDSRVKRYRTNYHQYINNLGVKTLYPPTSELLFRLAAEVGEDSVVVYKSLFVLFDLGTTLVLFALFPLLRRPPSLAVLYAWNPLVISEFAGNAHHDGLGIFFLTLAIYLTFRARGPEKELWPAAALAVATMAKGYTIFLVPFVAQCRGFRFRSFLLWFGLVVLILLLPYAGAGRDLLSGLSEYSARWERNDSLFYLISNFLAYLIADWRPVARVVVAGLLLSYTALMGMSARREPADSRAGDLEMLRRGYYVMALFFFLNPTEYPWYLTWLVPLLAVYPHAGGLLLVAVVSYCYCTWAFNPADDWVRWIEYVPVYALFLAQPLFDRLRARYPAPAAAYLTPAEPAPPSPCAPEPPA